MKRLSLLLPVLLLLAGSAFAAESAPRFADAKSWGYQLQNINVGQLAASTFDVLVIDYSRSGEDDGAFTADDLARLKTKPDGKRRIVLAYMSIGEAESYRFYWKRHWGWLWGLFAPSWRARHNGEWKGNFAVRYWEADWQAIILGSEGYLERIQKAGFDGVYLDKIDQFEEIGGERDKAKADMIAFVAKIRAAARKTNPHFLIVPQNGDELLTDAGYRAQIDGIGREDLLYGEKRSKKANNPNQVEAAIERLRLLRAENKPVLVVEYVDDKARIEESIARLRGAGFVPYFAPRDLNAIRTAP